MKQTKSMSFTKAVIDVDNMTITEETKDGENVFRIEDILNEWNGVYGVSITIKRDTEIAGTE